MKNNAISEIDKKKLEEIRKSIYEKVPLYDQVFKLQGRDHLADICSKDRFNEVRDMIVEDVLRLFPIIAKHAVTLGYVAYVHMSMIELLENILYGQDLRYFDEKETLEELIAREEPERSKREDFQCCRCRVLISAVTRGKEEFLDTFEVLVDSGSSLCICKMRCFEYCGIKE